MVLSKIPCLIFLSEPWLHLSDSSLTLEPLSHNYNFYLNSEDRHDDLLSLRKSRAHGGTLTLWRKDLDPYITIIHPSSSRILVMILDKPGYQTSIHVNIYLHTAGKESAFMEDLALLEDTLDELAESYPDSVTYIRGDANACIKPRLNNTRDSLFGYFLSSNKLEHVLIEHPTYHHFTNDGKSDSNLDVLLSSKVSSEGYPNTSQETLLEILCGKTNCLIDSSHDALFSTVSFSCISQPSSSSENISAPRIKSTKHKIIWSEEGITEYQELLANTLPALQDDFSGELQRGSASVLF